MHQWFNALLKSLNSQQWNHTHSYRTVHEDQSKLYTTSHQGYVWYWSVTMFVFCFWHPFRWKYLLKFPSKHSVHKKYVGVRTLYQNALIILRSLFCVRNNARIGFFMITEKLLNFGEAVALAFMCKHYFYKSTSCKRHSFASFQKSKTNFINSSLFFPDDMNFFQCRGTFCCTPYIVISCMSFAVALLFLSRCFILTCG